MTTREALDFLRSHQPMPPTREIDEDLLRRFDEVRKHFAANPDNRSVPLLLGSFGEGDGHGVYQLVEDAIRAHPVEVVVPALIAGLQSPSPSVRAWCAEIAANYANPELAAPLACLLRNGNVDERIAALTALEGISTLESRRELEHALASEEDADVRRMLREVLGR